MRNTPTRRVCFPSGTLTAGTKVRAVCTCGFRTTPRADQAHALTALLSEHGYTEPVCALCGADYRSHSWSQLCTRDLQVLTDPATGDEFLACQGMPQSCRDGAARRQTHLDRAAADSLGIELPAPDCA